MAPAPAARLRATHALLGVQSVVILLASINRLGGLTLGYIAPSELLRWVDLHNMLTIPLASVAALALLAQQIERATPARDEPAGRALSLALTLGVYLLGAGYGSHEVTNYLHARFCTPMQPGDLCRIIVLNDDGLSHWVWFAGFTLANAAVLLMEGRAPAAGRLARADLALLLGNGLLVGLGIFANLAFEEIGADLLIVALLALLALAQLRRRGLQPLAIYYSWAYGLGLVGTTLWRLLAAP